MSKKCFCLSIKNLKKKIDIFVIHFQSYINNFYNKYMYFIFLEIIKNNIISTFYKNNILNYNKTYNYFTIKNFINKKFL